jgi:hypothetical protein
MAQYAIADQRWRGASIHIVVAWASYVVAHMQEQTRREFTVLSPLIWSESGVTPAVTRTDIRMVNLTLVLCVPATSWSKRAM